MYGCLLPISGDSYVVGVLRAYRPLVWSVWNLFTHPILPLRIPFKVCGSHLDLITHCERLLHDYTEVLGLLLPASTPVGQKTVRTCVSVSWRDVGHCVCCVLFAGSRLASQVE